MALRRCSQRLLCRLQHQLQQACDGASSSSAPQQLQLWGGAVGWHQRVAGMSTSGSPTGGPLGDDEHATKLLVQRHLLVNTLKLSRQFEAAGLGRELAEQLSGYITELIVLSKVRTEETFVSKVYLEKVVLEQEGRVANFKAELTKAQEMSQANVNKDLDRMSSLMDKRWAEIRHELDKLTASQRLDMNLERGRLRDDFQQMRDTTTGLEIKVDREVNELKSSVEKAKNDTIKSVITILGTFSAIAFTIARFAQMSGGGG